MKMFLVSDEISLTNKCFLSEEGRMFNFEEASAYYEFGEAIYGHYLHGYDSKTGVKFVLHHHFEFGDRGSQIDLFMYNENGEAISEELIKFISGILGVSPIFREISDKYNGCHPELTWGHKYYLYMWDENPEIGIENIKKMISYRRFHGQSSEMVEFLYQG